MTRAATGVLLTVIVLICSAHVGSPDVWYDGPAGVYAIRVLVRPPQVVPGLAQVSVRVHGGADRVLIVPARFDTGPEGAPAPDLALPADNDPELFTGQLWLMTRGAHRIVVTVDGARGSGTAVVPVTASASERLGMSAPLAIALSVIAAFLIGGLITIVGAGVREGVLEPGAQPETRQHRRARVAMLIASVVVGLLVFGGWRWVRAVDELHRDRLDRPWRSEAEVNIAADGARVLRFTITDSLWLALRNQGWRMPNSRFQRASLIPDHGKLVHMFLVRAEDLSAFAHVHPVTRDSVRFEVALPALPEGTYNVYADVVDKSGAARTLTATVDVPKPLTDGMAEERSVDADDAHWIGPRTRTATAAEQLLGNGLTLEWLTSSPVAAGEEIELAFTVIDESGRAAELQPYMGMIAHAALQHEDGSVFIHLHPQGTISVAAQSVLASRVDAAVVRHSTNVGPLARVTFPYAFPKPGYYRVWIQIKHNDRIITAARDFMAIEAAR